jgi:beta-glucosidase
MPTNRTTRKTLIALIGLFCSATVRAASPDDQANELLGRMTLDEKIGQMTQVDMNALHDRADLQKYFVGSVLSGGDSDPSDNSAKTWLKAARQYQEQALKTRLKIPLIYGIDAVHGHNNVEGAVIFPHNIGLGATHNPALVERAQNITAQEVAATGIHWAFAPCVAVARDPRWGRTYESFGESPDLVSELAVASVRGLQQQLPNGASVLACAKHFVGDGGTQNGVDEGNVVCDEATLRKVHLAPYRAAIEAGVGSMMVSFSSWNGQKMHSNKHLLTDVLKGEMGFQGFLVSDWAAIDQLSADYKHDIETAINAGVDMAMIPNGPGQPNNYRDFIRDLKQLVEAGKVPQSRIDDAVRRILREKYRIGVFEHPFSDPDLVGTIGSPEHRQVARECVRQSLVLLKNNHQLLPLSKKPRRLLVLGKGANDLGMQCGGWTISWQGKTGDVTKGTTILAGIRQAVALGVEVSYSADGKDLTGPADAVIAVAGEIPYAEMKGDRSDLRLSPDDAALVVRAKEMGAPVITVLLSGRPLILGPTLEASDAFIAAWLPGTEGEGVADVLFGDYKPTGKSPRTWPSSNDHLASSADPAAAKPTFTFGYGLTYNETATSASSGRLAGSQ